MDEQPWPRVERRPDHEHPGKMVEDTWDGPGVPPRVTGRALPKTQAELDADATFDALGPCDLWPVSYWTPGDRDGDQS